MSFPAEEDYSAARLLLRGARTAALATIDRTHGGPLATLVALGGDSDGAPLLLLSLLSEHTKNLAADPAGSLLLTSREARGDPLNRPRLSLSGSVAPWPEPRARARYVRQNPKSKLYAGFGDFAVHRMTVARAHYNGGFGKAGPLEAARLLPLLTDAEALARAEESLIAALNAPGGPLAARLAGEGAEAGRRWRARSLDPLGADLALGGAVARLAFDLAATDPETWLARLPAARFLRL